MDYSNTHCRSYSGGTHDLIHTSFHMCCNAHVPKYMCGCSWFYLCANRNISLAMEAVVSREEANTALILSFGKSRILVKQNCMLCRYLQFSTHVIVMIATRISPAAHMPSPSHPPITFCTLTTCLHHVCIYMCAYYTTSPSPLHPILLIITCTDACR